MMKRVIWTSAVLLVLWAAMSQARVYWRWQGVARIDETLSALGGTPLYHSEARVNDADGELAVYGFEQNIQDVKARMARELTMDAWVGEAQMATASISEGRDTTRILVMTVAPERTVVVTFLANSKELDMATTPDSEMTLPHNLPMYPGSTVQFYAAIGKSGIEWMTVDAPVDAATAQTYVRNELRESGWEPSVTTGQGLSDGFPCYERDGASCWAWAIPAEEGLHSTTALLYRKAQDQP